MIENVLINHITNEPILILNYSDYSTSLNNKIYGCVPQTQINTAVINTNCSNNAVIPKLTSKPTKT